MNIEINEKHYHWRICSMLDSLFEAASLVYTGDGLADAQRQEEIMLDLLAAAGLIAKVGNAMREAADDWCR